MPQEALEALLDHFWTDSKQIPAFMVFLDLN